MNLPDWDSQAASVMRPALEDMPVSAVGDTDQASVPSVERQMETYQPGVTVMMVAPRRLVSGSAATRIQLGVVLPTAGPAGAVPSHAEPAERQIL